MDNKQTIEERYREIWRTTCTHPDSNNFMYMKTVEFISQELTSLITEILEKKTWVHFDKFDHGDAVSVEDILAIAKERGIEIN